MVITAQSPSSAVQLDSIRFSPGTAPSIDPLLIGSESDLLAAKRRSAPVAHMIREPDIGRLMTFAGCIVDCGTQKRTGKKGKTIELSRYLLKKGGKIPLIRAVYRKPGRAQQGIEQLLNKAYEKEDKNLYIVAVRSHIYEGLLEQMWEKRKHKPSHAIFMQGINDDPELAGKYLGRTREYVNVRKNILVAADGDLPVLIIGESGTGKEIVARCIHERSRRNKTGVFAAVNSAAIPGDLLEEELFGIEPGVVSGVSRLKKGLWEIADHGTIFLDEIGEMSLEHQRKILRVLQDGIIRRVGGTVDIQVDARVIAATNSDLKELIAQKKFREDLYYRLCVFTIYTPVLTSEALEHIAQECWRSVTGGTKPPLSGEIIKLLAKYALAGNVRTVKNVLKKLNAYMTAEGLNRIGRKYFEAAMRAPDPLRPSAVPRASANDIRFYREECIEILRRASKLIRRCKVVLRPFLWGSGLEGNSLRQVRSKLRQPHEELDELCSDPSAFYSQEVFRDVSRFCGRVINLRQLLDQNPGQARIYWDGELQDCYERALARIQDEIRQLVQNG